MLKLGADHMDRKSIHFTYWICILGALLIVSLSVEWGRISDLALIFSFALTFASLVLAVLAIYITISANDKMADVLGAVTSAATHRGGLENLDSRLSGISA